MRLGNRKINEAEINRKTRLFATNVSVANLIVAMHCPQIVQFRPWQLHLQKFCSEKIFATPVDVLCTNFVKFGRREIGIKVVRYLPDKKIRLALQISLLRGSSPKSARASLRQRTQERSRFHPYRFTFRVVIPEYVNTIKARSKVNPIFR